VFHIRGANHEQGRGKYYKLRRESLPTGFGHYGKMGTVPVSLLIHLPNCALLYLRLVLGLTGDILSKCALVYLRLFPV
jgi:hypothetical protein